MYEVRTLTMSAVALLLGMALQTNTALAQTAKDLVGTWAWVSVETTAPDGKKSQPFGPNPAGAFVFDSSGRYVSLLLRPGRAKYAANNRDKGTADEDKATVQGTLAHSGTYSVSGNTITLKVEASSYPNNDGTEQTRLFTLTGDDLKWANPAATTGGTAAIVLKRVK